MQNIKNYGNETELIRASDKHVSTAVNSGTLYNVSIDSGNNWKNITFEISTFVYGAARLRNLNSSDSYYYSKADFIQANMNLLYNILSTSPQKLTGLSGFFAIYKQAVPEKNPVPASMLSKIIKSAKGGISKQVISLKYLFKVTGIIIFHLKKTDGENFITVSKDKFVRKYCSIKLNDGEILRKVFYCLN